MFNFRYYTRKCTITLLIYFNNDIKFFLKYVKLEFEGDWLILNDVFTWNVIVRSSHNAIWDLYLKKCVLNIFVKEIFSWFRFQNCIWYNW